MTTNYQELVRQAQLARNKSYSPYSRFAVGAALLTEDGTIVTGANVENASFPLSLCAEHNAIGTAVAQGHSRFTAVAVVADPMAPPCGGCRQVLHEFGNMTVVLASARDIDDVKVYTLDKLLPASFGTEDLHGL